MIQEIYPVFKQAIIITGFVFVMMLVIEYINVQTKGLWQKSILRHQWQQYLLAAILGILPGCLGAFTAVAMFSHRLLSFGAIVTAMIATSGDEAFVMFAMIPDQALLLTGILFFISIVAGYLTDKFYIPKKLLESFAENALPLHKEEKCDCFPKEKFFTFLIKPSSPRLAMMVIVIALILGILTGSLAGKAELWKKTTLLISFLFSLFIVISVPGHFLREHLWDHVVKVHIPRIFLWTFGTLLLIHFLMDFVDVASLVRNNMLSVLILAVLVGIIPESGPHLVFVNLFAQGTIPFSILLASSIAQDGHGMLPLLAESKQGFITVKSVNILVALVAGLTGYIIGF